MTTNNPFAAVIVAAAHHTDMNAADNGEATSHPGARLADNAPKPNLSTVSPDGSPSRHIRGLRTAYLSDGPPGVREYKQRHPDAAGLAYLADVTVFRPKPPGYPDAVAQMVGGWLTSDDALSRTNRLDVEAINAMFGGRRFNPNNHLNKHVGKELKERLRGLFAQRGHILPKSADTLSKVKKAAKAAKAGTLLDASAFGTIGTLAGDRLIIGEASFRINRVHQGHDYVRLNYGGSTVRIRLEYLTEFLRQSGLLGLDTQKHPLYSTSRVGELGMAAAIEGNLPGELGMGRDPLELDYPKPDNLTRELGMGVTTEGNLPGELGMDANEAKPPSLAERIDNVAELHMAQYGEYPLPDIDPLDLRYLEDLQSGRSEFGP